MATILLVVIYLYLLHVSTAPKAESVQRIYSLPSFTNPVDFHTLEKSDTSVSFNEIVHIFDTVMDCYPAESRYGPDKDFRGNEWIGGVPITTTERDDRLIQQEALTRTTIISSIGVFMQAVEMRSNASRMIAIYRSLEARSLERVKRGLAPVSEQIGFTEKVASAYSDYYDWNTKVVTAGASVIAYCRNNMRGNVEKMLLEIGK